MQLPVRAQAAAGGLGAQDSEGAGLGQSASHHSAAGYSRHRGAGAHG